MTKIKIIQYNIRTGFRNFQAPYDYEGNRLEKAKTLITNENPDILLLNEAYFESKNISGILMDYQSIFNLPFYAHGNYKNGLSKFWGSVILSKYPIISFKNKNKGLFGTLSAKIKVDNKFILVDLVHLSPIGKRKDGCVTSKQQLSAIKNILGKKQANYILAGDFNSLSNLDNYSTNKLIAGWEKFHPYAEKVVNEMLKKEVISYVVSKNLIDTFKEKNKKFDYTIPTDFLSLDKSSATRIDYIFCSKDIKVLDSGIIKNNLSTDASDHYPTFAILSV